MAERELGKIRIGTENRGLREGQSRDMPKTETRKTKGMTEGSRGRAQERRGERGELRRTLSHRGTSGGDRGVFSTWGIIPNPFGQVRWAVCSRFRQDPNVCLEGSGGRRCWGNTHTK